MRDMLATLTEALLDGAFEQPLWGGFLDQLRAYSGAHNASMTFHPSTWHQNEALLLISGEGSKEESQKSFARFDFPNNLIRRNWMEEGKAYTLEQLANVEAAGNREFFDHVSRELGLTAALNMRVQEASGVDAWIALACLGGEFEPGFGELLEALAPVLRGALRHYLAREKDRFAATVAEDAVRRLQFGWIALDANAKIVGADRYGEHVLATSTALAVDPAGRLETRSTELQREIETAVSRLTAKPDSGPRAISLSSDPWLDMLLVPARHKPLAAAGAATAIAYVHGDNWSTSDRQNQLSELFSLTPREAELTLALCRGKSIAEAAGEIGITTQTARSYSKIVYAKTGARGQPDLVRIIMGSILALAPEG